jgi:hypothetical protein
MRIVAVLLAVLLVLVAVWRLGSQPAFDDTATVSGIAPTQNTDGSALVDLASIKIYRSAGPSGQRALVDTLSFSVPGTVFAYADTGLPNGEHCYVATAVRANGAESIASNQACKTIDTLFPNAPTGLAVE